MTTNRWQLHRAGLLNYWYYDEEEFFFANGRLLLRGDNGSGKSVTMQSFIPLLLDGKKSPDRLDPFGSRARKIEDYLLGEKGPDTPDERTGYLYLEFKQEDLERYLTIGLGLKVRRGQSPDSWGFSITDNRRIGHDLFLYKKDFNIGSDKEEKIPLSYRELENQIVNGGSGQVVKGQTEYMKMVNNLLFGFDSLDKYDELVKLLVQLRSPKLSKDFKPTVIYEILNNSLPALADDDLRTLSETLENMDNMQEQVEHLEKQFEAVKRLKKSYSQYNRFVIYDKARYYLREAKSYSSMKKGLEDLIQQIATKTEKVAGMETNLHQLEESLQVAQKAKADLEGNDAVKAAEEKEELLQKIKELKGKIQEKDKRLGEKEALERELIAQNKQNQSDQVQHEREMEEYLEELDDLAVDSYYTAHEFMSTEFRGQVKDYASFDIWQKETEVYSKRIEKLQKKSQEVTQAEERHQELRRDLGEISLQVESQEKELEKVQKNLNEQKDEFVKSVFYWQKENQVLQELTSEIQSISRLIHEYPKVTYDQLKKPIQHRFDDERNNINRRKVDFEHEIQLKNIALQEVKTELDEWTRKQDPEPERHPDVIAARKFLTEKQIPCIPFYAAVEFRSGIPKKVRAGLEATLQEIGLLDTLILARKDEEKGLLLADGLADSYFRRNPQIMRPTLMDYLEPSLPADCGVKASDVDEILRSILLVGEGAGETVVSKDGTYTIGLKTGKAPAIEQAKYIGREARRRFRQEKIVELTLEIESLEQEVQQLQNGLQLCHDALDRLQHEFESFPAEENIRALADQYKELRIEYNALLSQQRTKDAQWKIALEHFQKLQHELQSLLIGEKLPASEEGLTQALDAIREYFTILLKLTNEHNQYINCLEKISSHLNKLEEIELDLDDLRAEIRDFKKEWKRHEGRIATLDKLMQEMGIEEIKQQIEEYLKIVQQYPETIKNLNGDIRELLNDIKRDKELLTENTNQVENKKRLVGDLEQIFVEEAKLGFYREDETEVEDKPFQLAKTVYQELRSWVDTNQLRRQKVTDNLQKAYIQELSALQDYYLNIAEIFHEFDSQDERILDLVRRLELTVTIHGKKVSLYGFYQQLAEELKVKKELLDEEDRHLYEDIILKGLGKTIQTKIQRAGLWVKEMNRLMEERDTSSGLTFSLQWVPKGIRSEREMSAGDLVELLKRDPRLLREDDLQRLVDHFRSRIQEARAIMEEKGLSENLHQAIKDVLDYRQWFSFVLSYQKQGLRKKELTNRIFDTFSGGEKAMAMYIPLFSAVYSHYSQASDQAPRIISLDEAFAGVDENNIRDMFALVEQLGFNFIMNSQILWGDYDTISKLAIAELIRPKNARCVSVIHYYWNGKVRELGTQLQNVEDEVASTTEMLT